MFSKDSSAIRAFNIVLLALLMVAGCKKEAALTPQQEVGAMLASAEVWENPVVFVDGADQSEVYKDFNISFGNGTYKTTSGAPIWNPSGTWTFVNEEATLMLFDGATQVDIKSISEEILELSLLWEENTFEPGRNRSVKGRHVFKLIRKKKKWPTECGQPSTEWIFPKQPLSASLGHLGLSGFLIKP